MKQFIVLTAVLPILLLFMLQLAWDQSVHQKISSIQAVVYAAKEQAKQDGRFTEKNKEAVRQEIGRVTGVSPERVEVISDETVKYRYDKGDGRLIYYTVRVPIEGVMAGASFFRLSREENSFVYIIDSYTASEKL